MNKKKVIIPIVIVILISLLVGLWIFVIYPKFIKNSSNTNDKPQVSDKTDNDNNNSQNDDKNNNEDNEKEENADISKINETDLDDSIINGLISKINFNNVILADIYQNGDFNRDTIPNDLILKMGLPSWDPHVGTFEDYPLDPYNYMYWILSKELIEQNIKNLFGDIKYEHSDLTNYITCTSRDDSSKGDSSIGYSDFGFCLSSLYFENQQYKIIVRGDGGFGIAQKFYIQQIPYKVEAVADNKMINIYIKPYYSAYACGLGDNGIIYKSYDFDNNKVEDNIAMFIGDFNLENCDTNDIDITKIDIYNETIWNMELDKLKDYDFFDKLDSYVYTFELSNDGNYYLYSFKKVI